MASWPRADGVFSESGELAVEGVTGGIEKLGASSVALPTAPFGSWAFGRLADSHAAPRHRQRRPPRTRRQMTVPHGG